MKIKRPTYYNGNPLFFPYNHHIEKSSDSQLESIDPLLLVPQLTKSGSASVNIYRHFVVPSDVGNESKLRTGRNVVKKVEDR